MAGLAANTGRIRPRGKSSGCTNESVDLRDPGAVPILAGPHCNRVGYAELRQEKFARQPARLGAVKCRAVGSSLGIDTSEDLFRDWLRRQFAGCEFERLLAIFTDRFGRVVACEWIASGNAASVAPSARSLIARALRVDAWEMILAHNHPSGDVAPSLEDIRATRRLVELARPLGIHLLDHFVVAGDRLASFRERGIL